MELNIKQGQSIKLINNLFALEEEKQYFKKYKMRHPGELVLQKMKNVNLSLKDLLEAREFNDFEDKKEKIICDYILALNSLNESLLLIIKALTPFNNQKDIKEIDNWLKKYNDTDYTKFKDSTFNDNNFIRVSANNIKHGDVKIDYLKLTNYNNKIVKGFYFSSILDENQLSGAKIEIHPLYKNASTAFSFNHFILRTSGVLALNMYWINKILFQKTKSKPYKDNTFYNFFKMSYLIEKEFFPDEYIEKFSHIVVNKNSINIKYQKYISTVKEYDLVYSVQPLFKVDYQGKSNVKFPYWQLLR